MIIAEDDAILPDDEPVFDDADGAADGASRSGQKSQRKSVATQLVELAMGLYELGCTSDDRPFGILPGRPVVRMLTGGRRSLRKELAGIYYELKGKTASDTALKEAVNVLEYKAGKSDPKPVAQRVARRGDEVWIDLGDETERAVRVAADGWEVIEPKHVPVLFTRTKLTAAFPMPSTDGDMDRLWDFVNVKGNDRALVSGWMVASHLLVGLPCPILALLGEQGTAKTSAMRCALAMVDPSPAPIRRVPRDEEKWLHSLHGSRANGYDNLSSIPPWLSDAMCRAVTGEADIDRKLYTDDDLRIIKAKKVLAFTGIDVGVMRGDLAERCLWGHLEVIPKRERKSEREIETAWDEAYPLIFGGLLDLASATMQALPDVALDEKPRMADFAEVLAAIDLATGSTGLERYLQLQESSNEDLVEGDAWLTELTERICEPWTGTTKMLHALLPMPATTSPSSKSWPQSSRGVTGKLKRSAPALRALGWRVDQVQAESGSNRGATWVFEPPVHGGRDAGQQSGDGQYTQAEVTAYFEAQGDAAASAKHEQQWEDWCTAAANTYGLLDDEHRAEIATGSLDWHWCDRCVVAAEEFLAGVDQETTRDPRSPFFEGVYENGKQLAAEFVCRAAKRGAFGDATTSKEATA